MKGWLIGVIVSLAMFGVCHVIVNGIPQLDIAPLDSEGGEGTSVDIYFDKWVKFTEEPKVCNGVLTMSGRLTNGARFARSTDDLLAFVLYRHRIGIVTEGHSNRY